MVRRFHESEVRELRGVFLVDEIQEEHAVYVLQVVVPRQLVLDAVGGGVVDVALVILTLAMLTLGSWLCTSALRNPLVISSSLKIRLNPKSVAGLMYVDMVPVFFITLQI